MVRKRLDVQEDLQSRVQIFGALIIIALVVLVGRLWFLQIVLGAEYMNMAKSNSIKERSIEAVRGNIYDRNKKLFVASKPSLTISVIPHIFNKNKTVQKRLSKLLGMPMSEVRERMMDKKTDPLQPKVIKRSVDEKVVYYIKERASEFEGVRVELLPERDYVRGGLGAHFLGYVGEVSDIELKEEQFKDVEMGDIVGKTGIENIYNSALMGFKGKELIETNAAGRPVKVLKREAPRGGSSIMLTIDAKIQKYAEESLIAALKNAKKTVDKERNKTYASKGGAVVVMDPRNGDVLAMASNPTYNPKIFLGGVSSKNWKKLNDPKNNYPMTNRAITSAYAPGSTFKMFVSMAGLMTSAITSNTSFQCTGSWKGSPKWPNQFRCWKKEGHGVVSLNRAIVESCDIYFYNVGYKIYRTGKESIQKWSSQFGFGAKTRIDLPYEKDGRVPDKRWKRWMNRAPGREAFRSWYPGDSVNLSIGQGDMLTTPIQLANATAAIANGGTLYEPRLIKAFLSADGAIKKRLSTDVIRKIKVKPKYLQMVREGMKGVTQGGGTASGAFGDLDVEVAGKTGTSEVAKKQPTALFISYAPASNPRYVVVMILEEGGHGGSTAAPYVKEIYAKIFNKKPKKDEKKEKEKPQDEVETD